MYKILFSFEFDSDTQQVTRPRHVKFGTEIIMNVPTNNIQNTVCNNYNVMTKLMERECILK
jgi:hypothetical protein